MYTDDQLAQPNETPEVNAVPSSGASPQTEPTSIRGLLWASTIAVGDLYVAEYALRAVASEDNPLDSEMRQVVLCHAIELMHDRVRTIDDSIELACDHAN